MAWVRHRAQSRPLAAFLLSAQIVSFARWPNTAAAAPSQESDTALAQARLHFSNGVELLQSEPPNYQDAYRQFLLAYQKSGQSWKVLGNLGLCALKLERDGEALDYYQKYLNEGGAEVDPSERTSIERELLLIQGNMAHLELNSKYPGTRLSVARKGSAAPTQTYDLGITPKQLGFRAGELVLTASAQGKQVTWTIVLEPGQTETYSFAFEPSAAAEPTPPSGRPIPTPPPPTSSSASTTQTIGFISGGVGLAALAGGVVTGILAKDAERRAQDQCIGFVCPETTRADFDSAQSTALLSNVLFIAGGVLAATGITLVIVGSGHSESRSTARWSITPQVGFEKLGLSAQGRF